ncbi:hypothetical protein FPV67DRAFT_1664028 [Lyophyllum atratum]|nr:hypothetical protein FPV67DRAFT_1664028 [Lyophyllum atratum]
MPVRTANNDEDLNDRPLKRSRISSSSSSLSSSGLSSPSSTQRSSTRATSASPCLPPSANDTTPTKANPGGAALQRLPPATLLLALPSLLLHPPSHKLHLQSVSLAQHALRRCLALPALEPAEECRAWTGLAELGMMRLEAFGDGVGMGDVEQALTKAMLLSQKHPALRLYTPHLTILSARLAQHHQSNSKFAAHTLRRLLTSLARPPPNVGVTPPHVLFGAHLALVHSYWCAAEDESMETGGGKGKGPANAREGTAGGALLKCLGALDDMHKAGRALLGTDEEAEGTNLLILLVLVVRLQLLVRHGLWAKVPEELTAAELAFKMYEGVEDRPSGADKSGERPGSPTPTSQSQPPVTRGLIPDQHPIPAPLRVHLLMLAVLFHTYAGDAGAASERLQALHALLDTGVLGLGGKGAEEGQGQDGVIEIHFPTPHNTRPLLVRCTPPRVLNALAFLLSAVAKRDAVGRAPKKGVFARAGLGLREFGGSVAGFGGPEWTLGESGRERERVGGRMERVKADLMGEVVAISIMRSEFAEAQRAVDELTAHTRTHGLFPAYAARIALQHAQLAHARGDAERALRCYEVAAYVAAGTGEEGGEGGERDEWVRVAARAGEVWVRVGLVRARRTHGEEREVELELEMEMERLRKRGGEVVRECEGLGGTLMAVGEVLRACLAEEVLGAKQHLRRALDLATRAQDNHLRALVLALISAHYLHTAREHAMTMLGTCGQLAAGLGAVKKAEPLGKDGGGKAGNGKTEVGVGNAPLRLWVGERVGELRRWKGEGGMAEGQGRVNGRVREVVQAGRR